MLFYGLWNPIPFDPRIPTPFIRSLKSLEAVLFNGMEKKGVEGRSIKKSSGRSVTRTFQ